MCEEKHYDNTQFSQKLRTELCGAYNVADQLCFPKNTSVETKENALYLEFYPFSPMFLCEQQKAERWKAADTYTVSTQFWVRNVAYHNLNTYQN